MTSPRAGTSGNSPLDPRSSRCQLSATMRRSLISVAIYGFLERFDAEVVQVTEVVETFVDGFRHRDGFGVGERAGVAARAADDIGEQADIGRGESQRTDLLPKRVQIGELHVGEDQVLLVRDAQLAER